MNLEDYDDDMEVFLCPCCRAIGVPGGDFDGLSDEDTVCPRNVCNVVTFQPDSWQDDERTIEIAHKRLDEDAMEILKRKR